MTTIEKLEAIYREEYPCRIEWRFDGGWTWSIQNEEYPRLWLDNGTDGARTIIAETDENILYRSQPLPEMDWRARGNAETFEQAVNELYEATGLGAAKSEQ